MFIFVLQAVAAKDFLLVIKGKKIKNFNLRGPSNKIITIFLPLCQSEFNGKEKIELFSCSVTQTLRIYGNLNEWEACFSPSAWKD